MHIDGISVLFEHKPAFYYPISATLSKNNNDEYGEKIGEILLLVARAIEDWAVSQNTADKIINATNIALQETNGCDSIEKFFGTFIFTLYTEQWIESSTEEVFAFLARQTTTINRFERDIVALSTSLKIIKLLYAIIAKEKCPQITMFDAALYFTTMGELHVLRAAFKQGETFHYWSDLAYFHLLIAYAFAQQEIEIGLGIAEGVASFINDRSSLSAVILNKIFANYHDSIKAEIAQKHYIAANLKHCSKSNIK